MQKVGQEHTTGAKVRIIMSPDTVAGYANECGDLELELIEEVNSAVSERNYLAIAPWFVGTARAQICIGTAD